MAPKKQTKMALHDFLADQTLGSWADDMDELGPVPDSRPAYDGGRLGLDPATSGGNFMDRESRFTRPELPLPTSPPFTAHIGNLSFEATSEDVSQLFANCSTSSVRVVEDKLTGAPKGFGYVEFATQEGLKTALSYQGANLAGRSIRVSVAEPPKDKPGFRGDDDVNRRPIAADVPNWRSAPRPPVADPALAENAPEGRGFERKSEAAEVTNWRSAARPPVADPALAENAPEGRGFERKSEAAEVTNWRSAPRPPVADPAVAGGAPEKRSRRPFGESKFRDIDRSRPPPSRDAADLEADPSRRSKFHDPARGEVAPSVLYGPNKPLQDNKHGNNNEVAPSHSPQPVSAAASVQNWRTAKPQLNNAAKSNK